MCEFKGCCPYGKEDICSGTPAECPFKGEKSQAGSQAKLQAYNDMYDEAKSQKDALRVLGLELKTVHEKYIGIPVTKVLHDSLPLKYGSEFIRPQEFRKRQESGSYILKDDVLNLRISLESTKSVDEFLALI